MAETPLGQFLVTIVLPVFLGIIVTITVFFAKTFVDDTFMPWYKDKVDSSYVVRGDWKAITNPAYAPSTHFEETIYVSQLAERVWGDIFYKESTLKDGPREEIVEKRFMFEGT